MFKSIKFSFLFFSFSFLMIACGETAEKTSTAKNEVKKMPKSMKLKVGEVAPDFNLKNVEGEMISPASLDAKGYIVTFTCNTCPYSVEYEDRLIALHKKYAPQGYPVIAINPNDPDVRPGDSFEAMKVRSEEKSFPFEYLFDEGQKIFPQYGATKTPHVFILDKNRMVKYIGAIDDNHEDVALVKKKYVEDAIEAIEEGKDPDPSFTRAVGCSIKTKKKMM